MLLVHLSDCLVRVSFCHFSLPLGVGGLLRFVIVALPGLFFQLFLHVKELSGARLHLKWGLKVWVRIFEVGFSSTISNNHIIQVFVFQSP